MNVQESMKLQKPLIAGNEGPLNELVLVDDDILTIEIVSWIVRKSNYRTRLFTDPVEALDYLKSSTPRLLIVDYYMPGMTGLEFLQELEDCTDLDQTKTYLCSAVNPQGESGEQFKAMEVDLLEKLVVCDRAKLTDLLAQHLEALPANS